MCKIKIVVDIDDTISKCENRDYKNAKPIKNVIDKINYLHDVLNYDVTLFTSRGMVSCNGDVDKAKRKNDKILKKWLEDNEVHYDRIVYGKPIADIYVDDKCMLPEKFVNGCFCELKGGSGYDVTRFGDVVKKKCSEQKMVSIQKWYNEMEKHKNINVSFPKIISKMYDCVYMEFIDGVNCCDDFTIKMFTTMLDTIVDFSKYKEYDFCVDDQIEKLESNNIADSFVFDECGKIKKAIDVCSNLIKGNAENFSKHNSLCHGDFIISNAIFKENNLYLIDPEFNDKSSSFLLDFAKLRMSLMGYENLFEISKSVVPGLFLKLLDYATKEMNVYEEVLILNYMYIIRLWRYRYKEKSEQVLLLLDKIERTLRKEGII